MSGDEGLFVRGAQWVPIILFHVGLYLQDPESGFAVLTKGNPLFDACPADILTAIFVVCESLCAIGDLGPGDVEDLMKTFGATFQAEDGRPPQ